MSGDKTKLASTLKSISVTDEEKTTIGESCYYWGKCLENVAQLPPMNLTGIGDISIPISEKDICKVRKAASVSCSGAHSKENQNAFHVDLESSSILEKTFHHLAIYFVNHLVGYRVTDNSEVQMMLNQLIICTPGERLFPNRPFSSKQPGTFGKLVLQLPVASNYVGGLLEIATRNTNSFHASSFQSDQRFYCSAFIFSSTTNYEWHPVEQGCMAALDFDLVWRPASTLNTPDSISGFLIAAKVYHQIQESLSVWNSPEETRKDDQLFIIPLAEEYEECLFSFSALRVNDLKLTFLFRSLPFLDVHLAVISQTLTDNSQSWKVKSDCALQGNRSFKILRWNYSSSSLPQTQNYQLNIPDQLVGDINAVLRPDGPLDQLEYRHPAIVIQPRQQSIRRCCINNFEALLDYLESGRKAGSVNGVLTRSYCLEVLRYILQFCQEQPLIMWNIEPSKVDSRILRLLTVCKLLQVQEESLILINILRNRYVKSTSGETIFHGGIGTKVIAKAIVDMLQSSGGWEVFCGPVLGLITSSRLTNQLMNFSFVILALLEHRNIGGAYMVADSILSTLCSDFKILRKLSSPHVYAYVNAIIALQAHPDSVNLVCQTPILDKFIFPIFREMKAHQQYRLLIDLQKIQHVRLKNSTELYMKMTRLVLQSGFKTEGMSPEITQGLITCYVQQTDPVLCENFISKILWGKDSPELYVALLRKVNSSTVVKNALFYTVFKQSTAMEKLAVCIQSPSTYQEFQIITKLSYFFVILVQVEHTLQLDESTSILARYNQLYEKMPFSRLSNMMTNLIKCISKFTYPCGQKLLTVMGRSLINFKISTFKFRPPTETILELLKYFAALQDQSETLIHFILDICENCPWGPCEKNALLRGILFLEEILPTFVTPGTGRGVETLLFQTWISGLCQLVTSPDDLSNKIIDCMERFISREKTNSTGTTIGSGLFSCLLDKVAAQQLGFIMWELYLLDINGPMPSLKMFQSTLDLYRDVCRRFVTCDLSVMLQSTSCMIVEGTEVLLWLGDSELLSTFADKILNSSQVPNLNVNKILKSERIRQLVESRPGARSALRFVVEKYLAIVIKTVEKETALTWQMPHVLLPDYPGIEKFFHSTAERMQCINFRDNADAVKLSKQLHSILGSQNNFVVQILEEKGKSRCDIVKVRESEACPTVQSLLKEKSSLENFIGNLKGGEASNDCSQSSSSYKAAEEVLSILPHGS